MIGALHVLAPGLLTTIQDLGRPGYQRLGVPVGGALDPVSLRAANLLAGNAPGAAALEAAYLGPTLLCEAEEVRLAVVGAHAPLEILPNESACSGEPMSMARSFRLRRGEAVRIGALSDASVLYIAVEGGFDIAPVLGSVSTCMRGGFGGWQGRPLQGGDRLPLRRDIASQGEENELEGFRPEIRTRIRAVPGPQSDYFAPAELAAFFESEYLISAGSDRMGMRLYGRALRYKDQLDIISDALAPGSIQVPGDGQPIVLLADRQTTGGYPKIATVISADLPALGRMPVGKNVAFEPVTVEAAEAARRELFDEIAALPRRIVPVRSNRSEIDLGANLISGFIDAAA
jgi:biotin-dependent carboxylase-like uncharacterized protein